MSSKQRKPAKVPLITSICAALALIFGLGIPALNEHVPEIKPAVSETADTQNPSIGSLSFDELPPYSGSPWIEVNGNVPSFTEEERALASDTDIGGIFESYSELDSLGRCGPAFACI